MSTTRPGPSARSWRPRPGEIAAATRASTLVELGSGTGDKTRLLLDALSDVGQLAEYVPVDVSESALVTAASRMLARYPGLRVHAVLSDFTEHLGLPEPTGPRLVAFLGGTIGNLLPAERAEFLASLRAQLRDGDALLLGTDLVKDPAVLVAAYDDAAGVTADFNKNILSVLNAELDGNFDLDEFDHVAIWNAAGRVDRDAAPVRHRSDRAAEGDGPARPVRRRGRDADRDLGQVPARRDRRRARRGRARPAALVDRRAGQVRPVAVGAGLTSANGPRQPSDRVPLNRMTAG